MQGEFEFIDRHLVLHGKDWYVDGWVRFDCDVGDDGTICNVNPFDASLDIRDENDNFATGEAESEILDIIEEIVEDEGKVAI